MAFEQYQYLWKSRMTIEQTEFPAEKNVIEHNVANVFPQRNV